MINLRKILREMAAPAADPEHMSIWNLAPPLMLENILRSTVGLVNIAFLSRISDLAVSACSVANQYINMLLMLTTAITTGSVVCINQAIGMKNWERTNSLATITLAVNGALGVLLGLAMLFGSGLMLTIMTLSDSVRADAMLYMQIVGGTMVIQSCELVLSHLCRSIGKTKAPLYLNLIANGVNILLCYLIIFQPVPLPIHPILGVAVANVLSHVISISVAIGMIRKTRIRICARYLRPFPREDLKMALSIGIPAGINNIAYSIGSIATTAIISQLGEVMVSAKVYVQNFTQYVALLGSAVGSAGQVLIGYSVGAGDYEKARATRRQVTRIALTSNLCFSALLLALHQPLLRMMTQDTQILQIAGIILLIDFAVEAGRSLNNTAGSALLAAGDVRFIVLTSQTSAWLLAIGAGYLLAITCQLGMYGIWIAFALDECGRGLAFLLRWNSGTWEKLANRQRTKLAGKKEI